MKGSIRKRGDKYCIVVYLGKDSFGRKKQRWFSGYNSEKEAQKALPRILVKIQDDELLDNNKITLGTYANDWLKSKIKMDDLSPTTIDGYKNIIANHIIPTIGNLKLQSIKPYNLQKYFDSKFMGDSECPGLSARTLNNHNRILTSIFLDAVDMELISKNPLEKVKLPREKKKEVKPYDLEQSRILLDKVQEQQLLAMPVTLALLLGLRRGECLGLRWSDVDFNNKVVKIRQNLEYVSGNYYFKEPKTLNSIRDIAIPDILVDYLKEHKKWQNEMKLLSGGSWKNINDLVCTKIKDGDKIKPNYISDEFRRFLIKNNLPIIRFHDLRHTNATLMLAAGISSKVAQTRLGHSNISITLDLYSHVLKSVDHEASEKINTIFTKAK